MITPATIGSHGQFLSEGAPVTAAGSVGLLGGLQSSAAVLLQEHPLFQGDARIPIVLESVGDYIAEMNKLLSSGCIAALITTPDFRWDGPGNAWTATLTVQVNEIPAVNRSLAGQYVTSMRACEIVMAMMKDKQPGEMWGPWRPRSIVSVQSDPISVSYAVSGITKTILKIESVG